jgi:cytochrome c-type biogenesis protein CcmH/NrfG
MYASGPARRLLVALLPLIVATFLAAQNPPSNPPPSDPNQPGGAGTRVPQPRKPVEVQRPVFISGRVLMHDGSLPAERVAIERVCSENPIREGWTDSQGYFSLQLGSRNQQIVQDASISGAEEDFPSYDLPPNPTGNQIPGFRPMSPSLSMMGCELRASLAGYTSTRIVLTNRQPLDNPEVGTLVLYRMEQVQGTMVSVQDMKAPKPARKAREKAAKLAAKDPAEAEKLLRQALTAHPTFATAWFDLGLLLQKQQRTAEARAAFQQATASDPRFVRPYIQLALLASQEQDWKSVIAMSGRAVELNPFAFPEAYVLHALGNYQSNNAAAAEASARKAAMLDPDHVPTAHLILGGVLLGRNDYGGAADSLRAFLRSAPNAPNAARVRAQIADIEKKHAQSKTQPAP